MKTASRITLALGAATVLLAIWTPVGAWWQWALTALLLLLAGAGFGTAADMPRKHFEGGEIPTGSSTGPHLRFKHNDSGTTLEQITPDDVDQYKRTYGKPSKENDQR